MKAEYYWIKSKRCFIAKFTEQYTHGLLELNEKFVTNYWDWNTLVTEKFTKDDIVYIGRVKKYWKVGSVPDNGKNDYTLSCFQFKNKLIMLKNMRKAPYYIPKKYVNSY